MLMMNIENSKIQEVKASSLGKKIRYKFSIYGRNAIKWMRIVRPYMGERRSIKIDEIINAVISRKPFYELGPDFCAMRGHSIKYPQEYSINSTGNKQCRRCNNQRIFIIESNNDPDYVFKNPFEKDEVRI